MKRPFRWRGFRIVAALLFLLAIAISAEVLAGWRCQLQGSIHPPVAASPEHKALTAPIPGYSRPEDDTFLSYPEWYIVWSYQEKADFQQHHLPSGFPYFAEVAQYWNSYCCIWGLTRTKYAFNPAEHLMLAVIGTSFSAEYILKGAYEKTIGRLSEWSSGGRPVEEDAYAYRVARDYADFVHIRPFYEFRFAPRVRQLWTQTPLRGTHSLRKWERKAFLTLDYTAEALYCWIIEKLTHLTYGYEPANTYAWLEAADPDVLASLGVHVVRQIGPKAFIVELPRYQPFTRMAKALAAHGVQFVEIAGNTQVLLSAVMPDGAGPSLRDGTVLFAAPVLTQPGMQRVVIACEAASLQKLIASLDGQEVTIEHVYDY